MRGSNKKRVVHDPRTLPVACSGFLVGIALSALAQEPADVHKIDKIEVTGSNIKRTAIETALPVQIITREDIERSGAIDPAASLNQTAARPGRRVDIGIAERASCRQLCGQWRHG